MADIFIKPAADADGHPLLVRDPATLQPLAVDGEWKQSSDYWVRRLRDVDVIRAEPAPEIAAPIAAEPAPPASLLSPSNPV